MIKKILESTLYKVGAKALFCHEGHIKVLINNTDEYMCCKFRLDRVITFEELKNLLDQVYFPLLATGQISEEPRGKIYRTALRAIYSIADLSKYNSECYTDELVSKEIKYDSAAVSYYSYQSYVLVKLPVEINIKRKTVDYNNWL